MNIKTHLLTIAAVAILGSFAPLHAENPPKDYPLTTCPVSGDELGGSMGKAIKVTDDGTDVYLCCKMCKKDFAKDPAKYTKIVKDAAAANAAKAAK